MRDRRVKDLVYVAQKLVFINLDLLSSLLHHNNLGVFLFESTQFSLQLEESILVAELQSQILVRLLYQRFKRDTVPRLFLDL